MDRLIIYIYLLLLVLVININPDSFLYVPSLGLFEKISPSFLWRKNKELTKVPDTGRVYTAKLRYFLSNYSKLEGARGWHLRVPSYLESNAVSLYRPSLCLASRCHSSVLESRISWRLQYLLPWTQECIRQGPSECTEIFMLLSALKISHEVYDNPVPILTCVEARCCSKCWWIQTLLALKLPSSLFRFPTRPDRPR